MPYDKIRVEISGFWVQSLLFMFRYFRSWNSLDIAVQMGISVLLLTLHISNINLGPSKRKIEILLESAF